jgi:hypothetical protein
LNSTAPNPSDNPKPATTKPAVSKSASEATETSAPKAYQPQLQPRPQSTHSFNKPMLTQLLQQLTQLPSTFQLLGELADISHKVGNESQTAVQGKK